MKIINESLINNWNIDYMLNLCIVIGMTSMFTPKMAVK